ncbi:calmodulin-beta-like [Asterias rubens]|uniref:calmodulin-beta-like n=1 Tax=Asterias rubens TaxID=7604 RepID=UPI001455972A|nr:calmodulin-beta-like [Asterias rubens]
MMAMTRDLGDQHFSEFKEAFSIFDKDGDGTVTCEELAVVLRSIGLNPSKKELQGLIKEADVDGNNTIELNEFLALMAKKMVRQESGAGRNDDVMMTEEEIDKTFKVFDRNGNGFICAEEIRQVGALYGETFSDDDVSQMIKEADHDGDGRVSYEDFVKMMTSE